MLVFVGLFRSYNELTAVGLGLDQEDQEFSQVAARNASFVVYQKRCVKFRILGRVPVICFQFCNYYAS